jgi:hypothetical protein
VQEYTFSQDSTFQHEDLRLSGVAGLTSLRLFA